MPTRQKTVTIPVSCQIGRCPSAHMRALIQDLRHRIARGLRLFELVGAREVGDVFGVRRDVLQRVRDAQYDVLRSNRRYVTLFVELEHEQDVPGHPEIPIVQAG